MADPVTYGLHAVRVLLSRNPGRVQRVLLAGGREAGRHAEIRMLAERAGVKVAAAADGLPAAAAVPAGSATATAISPAVGSASRVLRLMVTRSP